MINNSNRGIGVFSRDDSSTTWSLSVQKDIKEDVMLYARAATGYKPGGFNSTFGLTADTRGFDKAESNNLEIGIKSRLLDNRVQFNAAIFDFEVEGQHYITQDASGLGRVVGNATVPSERLGFEASVIAKILPNLIFNAGLTVIDDGDPAPETNAQNRVSPDDAYVLGLSYYQPFMGGKLISRLDYTYDEGNYQNSSQPLGTSGWSGVPGYPEISQPIEVENLNFKLGWTNDDFDKRLVAFIRLGSDLNNNYYQIEIPLKPTSYVSGSSNRISSNDVWKPETNSIDIPISLLSRLKAKMINEGIDGLGYFDEDLNFINEFEKISSLPGLKKYKFSVKGNPSLGSIQSMMIGIKNPSNVIGDNLCGEVWFNELRIAGIKNQGGWAAVGSLDGNIADLANFSVTGKLSTIGFG